MTQTTIMRRVTYQTRNAGVIAICPADVNSGIRFVRRDVGGEAGVVAADWRYAKSGDDDLDLVNEAGVAVRKVSRVLAALKVSRINNATVEVEAETLDIDSTEFSGLLDVLEECGCLRQADECCGVTLGKCAAVEADGSSAVALPAGRLIVELFVESELCRGGWCLVIFDENFSGESGAAGDYDFGIPVRVEGGSLPPELVYRQMLSALGLLALRGLCGDMQLRGVNFTPAVGLKLLRLVDR
jgi:hypothetical protein